jgi:two-component system, NtrC family, nitrogen regulation response regulator NtrX
MSKILIIDDERSIRNSLKEIIEYENHEVETAENGVLGLELINSTTFELVFCDIKMPGMDGIEVLDKLLETHPEIPVVMISGHGNIETAVECIKKGAFDFIEKPLDLNRIVVTIKNAIDKTNLVQESKVLKRKVSKKYEMVGNSPAIEKIKEMIDKVAPTEARVLITGENGTGKEVAARWIHDKSNRANGPFVEVNCAAIPSELIESELFGHEKALSLLQLNKELVNLNKQPEVLFFSMKLEI